MNILLLGGGGREHALAWKMKRSSNCTSLHIAPGNAGTAQLGINLNFKATDFEAISDYIIAQNIDMVVVGPEQPLVEGIQNRLTSKFEELIVIGPSKEAARLEGSKAFAKEFMNEFNIPTAGYREFSNDTLDEGIAYLSSHDLPIVLKADGLAAGKGVLICQSRDEAIASFKEMLAGKFGAASNKVVVEEFLDGIEFSMFALTDGINYKLFPTAKDYKKIGEGDVGLNTGGMGAISPVGFVDDSLTEKVIEQIIKPTIQGIRSREMDYHGFVFFGIINVKGDPFVIEYNCRLGDPETEVIIPRLKSDLVTLFTKVGKGKLEDVEIEVDKRFCTTVMLVSGGYPESYEKGKVISGLELDHDSTIFHAGTKLRGSEVITNGGRVIAITSFGDTMKDALEKSYTTASEIQFEKKSFRTDIGFDL